jgi:predicted SprT family Zn-dependent metalloprotease
MPNNVVSYETPLITSVEYQAFQDAYNFFNTTLFEARLPQVLITMQRRARTKGYFSPERFNGRLVTSAVHELALNPDTFTDRSDSEILSTLVHEMCHVWQQTHGKPPRKSYHDRQWAGKMHEIGLHPSHTGEPGGKQTGQSMSHYILPDGPYAEAYAHLAATGFCLHWQSRPHDAHGKTAKNKTKYTCPECGLNAWAKPAVLLVCGECEMALEEQDA